MQLLYSAGGCYYNEKEKKSIANKDKKALNTQLRRIAKRKNKKRNSKICMLIIAINA